MSDIEQIYLDNAATTRVAPEVREAMLPFLDSEYGNPATLYALGNTASTALEKGRTQVAELINAAAPEEIYFTSGGTESDNWAITSTILNGKKKHLVTSAVEHHAVLETCHYLEKLGLAEVTVLPVDETGLVDPEALRSALRTDTALVSIMHANNEIGTVQPIAELADIAHEKEIPFHTDAVQTVGKMTVDVQELGVDMLSMSGHKLHGPKGVGAMYLRKGTRLKALLQGGGQERSRRSGTLNVPGIVGLGTAAQLAGKSMAEEAPRLFGLVEKLWQSVSENIPKVKRNGHPEKRLPGLLNFTVQGAEGEAMLMYLNMIHGICCSSGSACTTGSLEPSHVILALGIPAAEAHGSLRFTMSRYTTEAEINKVCEALPQEIGKVRAMSPTWEG